MHILYSCIGALGGISGVSLFNLAFLYEDATKISIIKTIDVFYSFLLQYFLLNIKIDLLGVIGAVFVLSSTFLIILFKIFEAKFKKMFFLKWLIAKF